MPWTLRRSFSRNPFRLTVTRRGVSPSVRVGRVSVSRRGVFVHLLRGLGFRF